MDIDAIKYRKFMENISPVPVTGCWLWMGELMPNGYGRIAYAQHREGAHRFAYRRFVCDPGKLMVLHKCDVPSCVNPDHLFAGTQADNMKDKAAKRRTADRFGEKHPLCRLTDEQVAAIHADWDNGKRQLEIAEKFGVTQSHVSRLLSGQVRSKQHQNSKSPLYRKRNRIADQIKNG